VALSRIALVLDHPKDVVNIGGVLRVMKNFGLVDLRLVNPDEFDAYRLEGIAHRTADLIETTRIHDSLDAAIADCTFVVGTTARARTAGRTYMRPRETAEVIAAKVSHDPADAEASPRVAILFGREDRGLMNEHLDRCHALTIIPTTPEYSSLNLAQAALVMAYELFLAIDGGMEEMPKGRRATRPPTQEELEETFQALAEGLDRIQFYKARKPEAVMRTLRNIIARSEPDRREAKLIAAIGWEIGNYLDRNLPPKDQS
jgi:tRNA/rRNA methyltransferase/tRNA (cytidine32/uridine32-2'-O)-methyltransferase